MKTLIVSCNNGGGHNAVAAALQETFRAHGEKCDVVDVLSFLSPGVSSLLSRGHDLAYRRAPRLMRKGYEQAERLRLTRQSLLYRALAAGAPRLSAAVCAGGYDTVLCTHVFAGMMLTACCESGAVSVSSGIVETDYTNSPGVFCCHLDRYFVADACFAEPLTERGVPGESVVVSGIPVGRDFYRRLPPEEARACLRLPPRHRHLVMMCGSMGCGPMEELTALLVPFLSPRQELTVVCGSNAPLRKKLLRRYADQTNVHVMGWVDDVSLLMDSADVLLTKPGGVSVSEAAVKGIPMVLADTVGGCEAYNAWYVLSRGMACTADDMGGLACCCIMCLAAPPRRRMPPDAPTAAEIVYDTMAKLRRDSKR